MNIVLMHEGSVLGTQIMNTWREKHSQNRELHLLYDCPLADLEQYRPNLVVMASDMPSDFERTVLEKCRELKLRVLSVLGRGSTVLLGPLETPDIPGCVTCLQLRWDNTFHHSFLNAIFNQQDGSFDTPLEMSRQDLSTLGDIISDEIEAIATKFAEAPHSNRKVGVYEQAGPIQWFPVVPSHDCPRCNLVPDDSPALAQLQFASHVMKDVEALRVGAVDLRRLEELFVHPAVGYISAVAESWHGDGYVQASAYIYTPAGDDIAGYGSGLTSSDAKQSAVLEVLERSCGFQAVNRRPVVRGTYSELSGVALHPAQFGFHLDALLRSLRHILEPFDEEQAYSWVWAYSTKQRKPVLIPEQVAYYGPTADEKRFIIESSNGCSLGGTIEEAVLHGTFEVLERDGFLNMWYAKMPAPELRLGRHCPHKTSKILQHVEEAGFEVRLFNLSHDLTIPAICAVAINRETDYPKVVSGSACHVNPYQAVYGALREVSVQVMNLQLAAEERREQVVPMFSDAKKIKSLHDHVAVAALPEAFPRWEFLLKQENQGQIQSVEDAYAGAAGRYRIDSRDIQQVLGAVLDDLHRRGFDVVVVNQTSAEVSHGGLNAVKALIPGMTPITFGYGSQRVRGLTRLFELPQRMGYSPRLLTEQDLNQDCHPFS